ncbi:MAG: signal transduction protein [Cycloclasticus sp. symbiont of Poecilosclerida sp. M]|nr:MAG: signal transduction protein [Cycloclasticus sp. symbiont of Poecilosclerida sp. M]
MRDGSTLKHQHFLPDFCRLEAVFYTTLIAQLLAILLALNTSLHQGGFWLALALNGLFILWVALISAGVICMSKKWITDWRAVNAGLFAFAAINASTLLLTWVVTDLLPHFNFMLAPQFNGNAYLKHLSMSSIVSAIILRYLYMQHQWKKQTKAEAEATLDALQARMRPHFLFNSLNTIASLTRENPALAETLTEDLSELFRASMQASGRMVRFSQEQALTRQYLNIEQTRLGERLQVNWETDSVPDDALIPPLSLQPLVENAVYHGIEPCEGKSLLTIKGSLIKNKITLSIQNPIAEQQAARKGNHIAIENLKLRLQSCFPDQSDLGFSIADEVYQAQVRFPYHQKQP